MDTPFDREAIYAAYKQSADDRVAHEVETEHLTALRWKDGWPVAWCRNCDWQIFYRKHTQ